MKGAAPVIVAALAAAFGGSLGAVVGLGKPARIIRASARTVTQPARTVTITANPGAAPGIVFGHPAAHYLAEQRARRVAAGESPTEVQSQDEDEAKAIEQE